MRPIFFHLATLLVVTPLICASTLDSHRNTLRSNQQQIQQRGLPSTPTVWLYYGCYTDNTCGRALLSASTINDAMTVESCENFCNINNFTLAGVEYGKECYCGNAIYGSMLVPDSECNFACAGNIEESCGAGNLLNLYSNAGLPEYLPCPTPAI